MLCYNIAGHGVAIRYESEADSTLLPSFAAFRAEAADDLVLTVDVPACPEPAVDVQGLRAIGTFDCGTAVFGVHATDEGGYCFAITDGRGRYAATVLVSADSGHACVWLCGGAQELRRYGLNNAVMLCYMMATARRSTLLMHSSVVVNDGRGYLFLGTSGTGKSTHTSLWLKHIEGSRLLNDDNPVLRIVDGRVAVYGSPWSGKTPCYRNESATVGGIVLLQQRPYNRMERQTMVEAMGAMLISVSSVKWDRDIHRGVLDTVQAVVSTIPMFTLGCLPDEAAARLSHSTLCQQ